MVRHSKCCKIFKSVSDHFGTLSIKGLKCDLKIRSHAFSLFDHFQFIHLFARIIKLFDGKKQDIINQSKERSQKDPKKSESSYAVD